MSNWISNYNFDLLKYKMTYDNVNALIVFYDDRGIILDINTIALEKLNYSKNNILDKSISHIYKDIYTTTTGEIKEMLAYRKNGSCFYVELLINKIKYNAGFIWISIATDITKQKDSIQESTDIKNELCEANKIKEEFICNITHELRTPINGILGWSKLTLDTELTNEQKRNINIIVNSAVDLMVIVNEILEFSKIGSNKVVIKERHFNMIEVVHMILLFNNSVILKNNVVTNFHISQDIPKTIIGDRSIVFQVLNNLMSSVIVFAYDGNIMLDIREIEFENNEILLLFEIIYKNTQTNEQINLFGEEDSLTYEKIWGTKLGIDICRKLIEAMGGNIKVISKNKTRNIFSFTLKFKLLNNDIKKRKKNNKGAKATKQEWLEDFEYLKTNKMIETNKNNENHTIKLLEKLNEYIVIKDQEKAELIAKTIKDRLSRNSVSNKKIFKIQLELRKENFIKAALELENLNAFIKKENLF